MRETEIRIVAGLVLFLLTMGLGAIGYACERSVEQDDAERLTKEYYNTTTLEMRAFNARISNLAAERNLAYARESTKTKANHCLYCGSSRFHEDRCVNCGAER